MRLGVLGGTFDPVHVGHLILGEAAREELALDRVLFVPAGQPGARLSGRSRRRSTAKGWCAWRRKIILRSRYALSR
jgi:nicotinic acid mononucleotide adenylyltransferase